MPPESLAIIGEPAEPSGSVNRIGGGIPGDANDIPGDDTPLLAVCNPGLGVGDINCGDNGCSCCGALGVLGKEFIDGVADGGIIPLGGCGDSNRVGKLRVGKGDDCRGPLSILGPGPGTCIPDIVFT